MPHSEDNVATHNRSTEHRVASHWVRRIILVVSLLVTHCSLLMSSAQAMPAVLFTDVQSGPTTGGPNNLGVPISIFGRGFGAIRGNSTVTIGGVPVASYMVWG